MKFKLIWEDLNKPNEAVLIQRFDTRKEVEEAVEDFTHSEDYHEEMVHTIEEFV